MKQDICSALEEQFVGFASENILNNLPFVSDGLLAVQRKSIWGMIQKGRTHDKQFIKMLKAQGEIMTYYVFGDMPLTGALKNMGNNSLNYMYLTPRGSFGDKRKKDDNGAAARYIECKLSEYAEDMCKGIKKNNVPTKRNYDNTENEPIVLPSAMPNVLLNTSQSISVGESSKIPAHNLNEVCDSFISYLQTQDIDKSISMLNGADLSLGGQIVYDKQEFEKIYRTGKGSFTLVGKYTYDEKENRVTITEIPYETYIETIEEKLRLQYDKGNFKEVSDIHDGSDKDGIKLHIYLKKGTNINQFIAKLRKLTPFESKMSCNFTLIDIDNKTPMLMSLEDIIVKWTQHRKQCIKRELEYDINKLQEECNRLMGLELILFDLDKAIELIRGGKTEQEAMDKLESHFKLNQAQLDYICGIKLINMNSDWLKKKISKLGEMTEEMNDMIYNIANDTYYTQTIISQLTEIKSKYGKPRMTSIIHEDEVTTTDDILIPDETCAICITKDGYVKRTQRQSTTHKLKDGDEIILNQSCTTKHTILLFTNKGNVHKVFVHTLDQTLPSNLGQYLYSLVQMDKDEKIISVQLTRGYKGYLINVFENNKLAKVNMSSFQTEQKRTTLKNAISLESPLIAQYVIDNDIDMFVQSTIDKCLIVNTSDFNPKNTKNVSGDSLIKSKDDSVVKLCYRLSDIDTTQLDVDYYRGKRGNTGCYLKKTDSINIL